MIHWTFRGRAYEAKTYQQAFLMLKSQVSSMKGKPITAYPTKSTNKPLPLGNPHPPPVGE